MKYTSDSVQTIISDLDFAEVLVKPWAEANGLEEAEFKRVARSIKRASYLLTELPDESFEQIDDVYRD